MTPMVKMIATAGAGALATVAAGALALTAMGGGGLGPMGRADANGDGQVTRAEWLQAANARFAALDANHDGKLVATEMPRGHRHGHHGERWGEGAPPQAAPAQPAPATPAAPATPGA